MKKSITVIIIVLLVIGVIVGATVFYVKEDGKERSAVDGSNAFVEAVGEHVEANASIPYEDGYTYDETEGMYDVEILNKDAYEDTPYGFYLDTIKVVLADMSMEGLTVPDSVVMDLELDADANIYYLSIVGDDLTVSVRPLAKSYKVEYTGDKGVNDVNLDTPYLDKLLDKN